MKTKVRRVVALLLAMSAASCTSKGSKVGGAHEAHEAHGKEPHEAHEAHDEEAGTEGNLVVLTPEAAARVKLSTTPVVTRDLHSEISTTAEVGYDEDHLAHVELTQENLAREERLAADQIAAQSELAAARAAQAEAKSAVSEQAIHALRSLRCAPPWRVESSRNTSREVSSSTPKIHSSPSPIFEGSGSGWTSMSATSRGCEPETPPRSAPTLFPEAAFQGRVSDVGDRVEPATRVIRARIEVDNADGFLRPGMFARVRLSSAPAEGPLEAVPDVTNVQVQILTNSPGLAPEEVEKLITTPVEMSMSGLPDADEIRSVSKFGLSVVTVAFAEGTDIYWACQLVGERLVAAPEEIPGGYGEPEMGPISTGLGEIYQFEVKGEPMCGAGEPDTEACYTSMELRTILDWFVIPQLRSVPGIVEVNAFGGELKTWQVTVDPKRLLARGLPIGVEFAP